MIQSLIVAPPAFFKTSFHHVFLVIPSLSVFDLDFSIGHLEAACKTDRCLKFVKLQSEGERE